MVDALLISLAGAEQPDTNTTMRVVRTLSKNGKRIQKQAVFINESPIRILLAIDFTTMTHFYHEDKQPIIFNGIDNAIVSHPNPVELVGATEFYRSMRTRRGFERVDF